ncbi:MAG: hypothetical protein R2932_41530 [Caldilineaceae bacterium]
MAILRFLVSHSINSGGDATGLGDDGIPEEIEGYQRLNAIQAHR